MHPLPRRLPDGTVTFRVKAEVGQRYVLEGTQEFPGDWNGLQEITPTERVFTMTDKTSATLPLRFFRLRLLSTP